VAVRGEGAGVSARWLGRFDRAILPVELLALAAITREAGLPALAAGLVDGRQLDEITIFVIDGAPIAASAIDIRAAP